MVTIPDYVEEFSTKHCITRPLTTLSGGASKKVFYRTACQRIILDARADPSAFDRLLTVQGKLSRHQFPTFQIYKSEEIHRIILMEDLGDRRLSDPLSISDVGIHRSLGELLAQVAAIETGESVSLSDYAASVFEALPPTAKKALVPEIVEALLSHLTADEGDNQWGMSFAFGDFEPENIMVVMRRGTLTPIPIDFDDSGLAPAYYDLASICYKARHDTSEQCRNAAIEGYAEVAGLSRPELTARVETVALVRSIRTLGILAALSKKKPEKYQPFVGPLAKRITRMPILVASPALQKAVVAQEKALEST